MSPDTSTRDVAAVELTIAGGKMTPLHVHATEESFRVLEGELAIHVGGHVVRLGPGAIYRAPAGVPHALEAPVGAVRYIAASRVRSVSDYREFQRAVAVPDRLAESSDDLAVVAALGRTNGIAVLGPPGAVPLLQVA